MIYCDKNTVVRPACLDDEGSRINIETKAAIKLFQFKKNKDEKFEYKEYRNEEIKTRLIELFNGKCCYCETRIVGSQPGDIEHFRPKGKVIDINGNEIRPGYYWLAGDWDNLLYACRSCNSLVTQVVEDDSLVLGKGNKFPVLLPNVNNVNHRISLADEEKYRLLINPCKDNPEEYFEYNEIYATINPKYKSGIKAQKAEMSIDVYGLKRIELVVDRKRILLDVKLLLKLLNSNYKRLKVSKKEKKGGHLEIENEINEILDNLATKMLSNYPYSGLVRQLIKNNLKK